MSASTAADESNTANQPQPEAAAKTISTTERLLGGRLAPAAITAFFLLLLLIWSRLDHSLPAHDAVCHSNYSSLVENWLCRPRSWSLESLRSLLTLMPNYPAGSWFFNAVCKILVGHSRFSEQLILALHLAILNFGVWTCSMLLLKDRLKASFALIFLNCCPVVLFLQHLPYIDLQHTSMFMLFFCSLVWWWQKQTWRRASVLALAFTLCCLSKQIAILYTAPILAVCAAISLYKRRFASLGQLIFVAAAAALGLLSWVIPNWNYLIAYSHERNAFAAQHLGLLSSMASNLAACITLVCQSLSRLLVILLLLSARAQTRDDLKSIAPLIFASAGGAFLICTVAYYNRPESRYYVPLVVALAIMLGAAAANIVRKSRRGEILLVSAALACVVQAGFLCFQSLPAVFTLGQLQQRPVNFISGISEKDMLEHLAYVPAGDAWKQEWLFSFIEAAEHGKPVYLNVLSNSNPYNLGTLAFVGKQRKSRIMTTTWRGIGPDISDTFSYTDESLRCMQWVLEKTGDENGRFFDKTNRENYLGLLHKLRNGGKYMVAAQQDLPDGSQLILYRNKDWM